MSVSRTISLPDEILDKAEEFAAREHISLEELVSAALFRRSSRALSTCAGGASGLAPKGSGLHWIGFPIMNPSPWITSGDIARGPHGPITTPWA